MGIDTGALLVFVGFWPPGVSNRAQNIKKWPFWLFLGGFDVSKWSDRVQFA